MLRTVSPILESDSGTWFIRFMRKVGRNSTIKLLMMFLPSSTVTCMLSDCKGGMKIMSNYITFTPFFPIGSMVSFIRHRCTW